MITLSDLDYSDKSELEIKDKQKMRFKLQKNTMLFFGVTPDMLKHPNLTSE